MDLFVDFEVVTYNGNHCIINCLYAKTYSGRKIVYAVIKFRGINGYDCYPAPGWTKYLEILGLTTPEVRHFTSMMAAEEYAKMIFNRLEHINYPSPCNALMHFPDITYCTVTWFSIEITDSIILQIPNCMHRHLMQHLTTKAVLWHYSVAIEVEVENMRFTTGMADFFVENDLSVGDIVLFRHTGYFTFETYFYKCYYYSPQRSFNQYGDFISTPRYSHDATITVRARSAIPPTYRFNELEQCRSMYIDFYKLGSHHRLSEFLTESYVSDGPLEFIVGDKKLELHYFDMFHGDQWEQITNHFQINEGDHVVCFNIRDNVIVMLVLTHCQVEKIYPWSIRYSIHDYVYGEINTLNADSNEDE